MTHTPTTFYSASAGSGKTFTLARDYLTLLFQHPFSNGYRQILAVTFTNKAVKEMKERILEYLLEFTKEQPAASVLGIKTHIQEQTGFDDSAFQKKASAIHNQLLHDYSAFDIVTIDSFNHRILRTFSKDIQLPDNFEVELDSKRLISKAIHQLLSRAGQDTKLTKLLVEFSLSKIDDGRSWDIEYDLHDIAQLILNENHYPYLKQLKSKEVGDFLRFRESLQKKVREAQSKLQKQGTTILEEIKSQGLSADDFHYKANRVYKFINEAAAGQFKTDPNTGYIKNMETNPIANKSASDAATEVIEGLRPRLVDLSHQYRQDYGAIGFYKNIAKSLTALSLLNELLHEIDLVKAAEQIVPIYEFNALLAEQIKGEPAPFIYERLGERYTHFFIDEFQDTSRMQWENIQPLIGNALQQEKESGQRGSLMLVGDAKQSIYRWRGGDADQFLRLLAAEHLFEQSKENLTLGANWRSYDNIINFNNDFFKLYGTHLEGEVYQSLYADFLKQETKDKPGGYIQIDFLDPEFEVAYDDDEGLNSAYPHHVLKQVWHAMSNGFEPGEICVLVRTNKQGHEIAQHLVAENIRVVSGDSLLVHVSTKVQLLVQFIRMVQFPDQQQPRFDFLLNYAQWRELENIHAYIATHLTMSWTELCSTLFERAEEVKDVFTTTPLFQATERVAAAFGLFEDQDTRLQAFMEFVLEYSTGKEVSLSGLLEHWELKKEGLSVPATADPQAVLIMTIHKSKGLEFPVVIAPHCDVKLDDAQKPKSWVPVDPATYEGFEQVYISLNKDNLNYPAPAPELYALHLQKAQMDHINALYVAFTRAREQLYISAVEKEIKKSGSLNYSQLLMKFVEQQEMTLEQKEGHQSAVVGDPKRLSERSQEEERVKLDAYKVHFDPQRLSVATRKGMLWATGGDAAIEKGNLLHDYLSQVNFYEDLEPVLKKVGHDQSLVAGEKESLTQDICRVLDHPETAAYFKKPYQVLNERAILLPNGNRLIPDRLLFEGNRVTIIDYKTGALQERHRDQLDGYAVQLQLMGWVINEKVLVYTDAMEIVKWS